uniref:Large ribosomal subunit protein uL16m n=1 Tax=prasinophyte sp. MBIC10622 TaxID=156113 RepID=A0A650AKI3_9CHLO|nr:ribosomal protein L16 [prasinophyte sp. MBIC10622]
MLQPKRSRYRKHQKGRVGGYAMSTDLSFGLYGIQALEEGRLSARVIEASRRTLTRKFRRTGQVWIRVFPDLAVSSKPAEVRMGKGKGAPSYWAARVKAGQMLFEMDGVSPAIASQAARLVSYKMPFSVRFVYRQEN